MAISEPDLRVTLSAEDAYALTAQLLDRLAEYSKTMSPLPPLQLANGQQLAFSEN